MSIPDAHNDAQLQEELRRRMRAAMALAGLTVEQLADRIDLRGYGAKTLYNMQSEASDRVITPRDYAVIAEACGVDAAFFTIDFADLGQQNRQSDIQAQVAGLAEAVIALASGRAEDALRAARAATEQPQLGSARGARGPGPRAARPQDHRR